MLYGLDAYERKGTGFGAHHAYFVGAGVFAALGLYGYPPGRVITVALAAFLPVALALRRHVWRRVVLGFAILFAAEAITFAPEAAFLAHHWHAFNGRTDVVRITSSPEYKADPVGTMLHQIAVNLRGPWDGAVNNTPQYTPGGEPQLDRLTGVLVLAGMAVTLLLRRFRRQPETWLWWLMLLAGWVLTQLFTVSTPNGVRGIGLVPPLVYFAAVGVNAVLQGAARLGNGRAAPAAAAAVCAAVVLGACLDVRHYVEWQRQPSARQARYLYVTDREFHAWASDVVAHTAPGERATNVGEWRTAHPLRDVANPYKKAS
jgi:hypothetical protein